jgi:hypothetical protein
MEVPTNSHECKQTASATLNPNCLCSKEFVVYTKNLWVVLELQSGVLWVEWTEMEVPTSSNECRQRPNQSYTWLLLFWSVCGFCEEFVGGAGIVSVSSMTRMNWSGGGGWGRSGGWRWNWRPGAINPKRWRRGVCLWRWWGLGLRRDFDLGSWAISLLRSSWG